MIRGTLRIVVRGAGAALVVAVAACNSIVGIDDADLGVSLCSNTCQYDHDGQCDDINYCTIGSDCADCGERWLATRSVAVGANCTSDAKCQSISAGYCAPVGVCTATCVAHSDCGCPAGTTNQDVAAGRCSTQCVTLEAGATSGFCFRTCLANSQCASGSSCDLAEGSGICIPDDA